MRIGLLVGLLIGAVAAIVAMDTDKDLPAAVDTAEAEVAAAEPEGVVEKVKAQARLALAVAREASREKQEEMLRDFEAAKQQHAD